MKLKEFQDYLRQRTAEDAQGSPASSTGQPTPPGDLLSHIEFYTLDDGDEDAIPPTGELFIDFANSQAALVEKAVGAEAKVDALANMMALLMVGLKATSQ